jgi:hypothetical protein
MGCGFSTRSRNSLVAETNSSINGLELSCKRFTTAYLQILHREKQSDPATRTKRKRQYRTGNGEDAPGFPAGGLASLTMYTRANIKPSCRTQMDMPMWISASMEQLAVWVNEPGPGEPYASDAPASGPHMSGPSLQDKYAEIFGDKPPRLLPMLRKARKEQARAAAGQRAMVSDGDQNTRQAATNRRSELDANIPRKAGKILTYKVIRMRIHMCKGSRMNTQDTAVCASRNCYCNTISAYTKIIHTHCSAYIHAHSLQNISVNAPISANCR